MNFVAEGPNCDELWRTLIVDRAAGVNCGVFRTDLPRPPPSHDTMETAGANLRARSSSRRSGSFRAERERQDSD